MRISWTISWYVFRDLLKIFMITSGVLAGIMSFGVLLRPLTQQGLDIKQAGELLSYLSPAMTAYSVPIAALFAAAVVYGRLSADNEITACRACGISHLGVAMPALALGLIVALVSLLLLSFVVPNATLKVEKVIKSNIARIIAASIDRNHQIKWTNPVGEKTVIFAQEAYLPELSEQDIIKGEQQVVLVGPTIVMYERPRKDDWHYRVPKEFWTAGHATAFISRSQRSPDEVELMVALTNGTTFPRDLSGGIHASIGATQFGPVELPSPIKETPKFMDLWQLRRLYQNQQESRRIMRLVDSFIDNYQKFHFLWSSRDGLNTPRKQPDGSVKYELTLETRSGDHYVLERGPRAAFERAGEVIVGARPEEISNSGQTIRSAIIDPTRNIRLWHLKNGRAESVISAYDARIRARPRRDQDVIEVNIELHDALIPSPEGPISRGSVPTPALAIPIPPEVRELEKMPLQRLISAEGANFGNQVPLKRELIVLTNDIISESNFRASFAVSCLILVMVGCALGMMFRSGNFLTAFAISFVPALLSITLIVAGQQVCGNIGWKGIDDGTYHNPLALGTALIWSGNVANAIIAVVLLGRLWRT